MITAERKIAKEILKKLIDREIKVASVSLEPEIADLAIREAKRRLRRNCKGDDDEEFFRTEEVVVMRALAILQSIALRV